MSSEAVSFPAWLSQRMEGRGLNQPQLGQLVGVHKNTVHRWVRGLRLPRLETMPALAEALRVPIEEVIARTGKGHRPRDRRRRDNALPQILDRWTMDRRLTTRAAAAELDVNPRTLYHIRDGTKRPRWVTLLKLADGTGIPLETLAGATFGSQAPPQQLIRRGVGEALYDARVAKGLSLSELARLAGVPRGQLERVEYGRRPLSARPLLAAGKVLGLNSVDLLIQLGVPEELAAKVADRIGKADPNDLPETLPTARRLRGLTQGAMSRETGVHRNILSGYETGRTTHLDLDTMLTLASFYDEIGVELIAMALA
jgi:transcriptional regulator with XRE-family HTH domain